MRRNGKIENDGTSMKRLSHWGRVTHICVSELPIIGSDNGLSPGRRQAIIWTNAGILLIDPFGTNFNEILIEIQTFSFRKMHLKMSSAKWRPFCLGLNVLKKYVSGCLSIQEGVYDTSQCFVKTSHISKRLICSGGWRLVGMGQGHKPLQIWLNSDTNSSVTCHAWFMFSLHAVSYMTLDLSHTVYNIPAMDWFRNSGTVDQYYEY